MSTVPLEDAVEFNPKPARGSLADDFEVSFAPMAAVEAGSGRMDLTQVRAYVNVKKGFTPFRDGDVLFAKITPCMENGKMAVAQGLHNGIGFGSTEFHVLRPRHGVDGRYVYHFVSSARFRREAAHHMTGAVGQKRVPLTFLQQSELPLPPINEQRRIVAEIEKQFSRLDEAVANLRRVKTNLGCYRGAVLQTAIQGGFVSGPDGIKPVQLKELIGKISQGWSPKCDLTREASDQEWAVVTTTAVQPMQYLDNQGKALPAQFDPRPNLEIQPGDFLMTRKGPRKRAGVACLVRRTRPRLMVCDTVYRFRCDTSKVVPGYLELALNAPSVVDAIDRHKAGINESGVSLTHSKLGSVLIPVPHIEAQASIVAEVDRRLSIVREVEAEVDANLKRAQALRQAVLSKAFATRRAERVHD
jgi:type I restriction enzyme S subunit